MFSWHRHERSGAQENEQQHQLDVPQDDDTESLFDSDIGPLLYAIEPELKRTASTVEP